MGTGSGVMRHNWVPRKGGFGSEASQLPEMDMACRVGRIEVGVMQSR